MSDTSRPLHNPKYAWTDLARVGLPKRSAAERVADFLEIYGPYDEATAREQASRCIQCPNPACVTACPLASRIPEWLALTAEGHFLEAAELCMTASNMAEVCVRACPQDRLCESGCLLNGAAEPVAIGALEQFITEYAFAHGGVDTGVVRPNGARVAVVGSGPSGLTCAGELARRGYAVTLLDSTLLPDGLLVNGIPAFKLDKAILERRIDLLKKRGVVFRLGIDIVKDLTLSELRAGFDAVFLGFGARRSRPLAVPGADLAGVMQALPFIVQRNTDLPLEMSAVDVSGRRVVVLGGGDTAMDCLRTALRCGARETIGVYRRDEESMPASRYEYENAVEEGARFVFLASVVAVLGDDCGRVKALRLVRTELDAPDASGRRPFRTVPGTEFELAADWVFLALGFDAVPFPSWNDFGELATNSWGGLSVDANLMTNISGIFAGGDIVRGPGTVVQAAREARRAAAEIDAYLSARGVSGSGLCPADHLTPEGP